MHWFNWLEQIVAHLCEDRQHEAPTKGHYPLSRTKDEDPQTWRMPRTALFWWAYGRSFLEQGGPADFGPPITMVNW